MNDNTVYLAHHGILGQKWGVRRYQTESGSLTPAGQKRYAKIDGKYQKKINRSKAQDEKILSSRKAHRDFLENKLTKLETKKENATNERKISKLDKKIAKRENKIKDFDEGTKMVKAGLNRYNKTINDYKNLQLSKITDKNAGKTEAAKKVAKAYRDQKISDIIYGYSNATKLNYAIDAGQNMRAKKNSSIANKATKYGGEITKDGKYKASNGVVISESRNKSIAAMRKFSTSTVGSALGNYATRNNGRAAVRADREREALREYYKVGGDKTLKRYKKY